MKKLYGYFFIALLIALMAGAEGGGDDLWLHMADHGLITQDQYQHVQQYGRLPGGTEVVDSPVPVEKQEDWNALAAEKVISVEELASVLFEGAMPKMTKEETRAFEELAPVYQPDRSKRLGYELRRKHQKIELIRLKHRMYEKYSAKYEEAKKRANELGIPLRIDGPKSLGTRVAGAGERELPLGAQADSQQEEELELPQGGMELLLSGHSPANKDLWITSIQTVSNQNALVSWDSVVGSLHTVISSTNLSDTNSWVEQSAPLSIISEKTDWEDETSGSDTVRFYRILQTQ